MPFNSIAFIVFFVLFLCLYYCAPEQYRQRTLLFGSWLFYLYGGVFNLVYVLVISLITTLALNQCGSQSPRARFFRNGAIFLIVLLLVASRWLAQKFIHFENEWLVNHSYFNYLIQPIGISFYSLQAIGLLIDSHRKPECRRHSKFASVSLFLSFFPQALAGPIHRAHELMPQLSTGKPLKLGNLASGARFMLCGYYYKLVLADKIAALTLPVNQDPEKSDGLLLFVSSLLYSLQIYFDFFGYSLIAIGAGGMLGFRVAANFRLPYRSASFREFWHRWHISLSMWLRDYVYLPFRRQKTFLTISYAIALTFLISGLWHGFTAMFVIWGAIHALLYLIEYIVRHFVFNNSLSEILNNRVLSGVRIVLMFVLISLTWIPFYAETVLDLHTIIIKIFSISQWSFTSLGYFLTGRNITFLSFLLLSITIINPVLMAFREQTGDSTNAPSIKQAAITCICLVLIILFGDINAQQFLYFRF